jgi:hypothetical protein
MSERILALAAWAVLACLSVPAWTQPGEKKDDKAAKVPTPPKGSDARGDGKDRGKQDGRTIKDVYKDHFLIGMAGDLPGNYSDQERGLVTGHFNMVTPENCMKPGPVHPSETTWRFERPDALVQ